MPTLTPSDIVVQAQMKKCFFKKKLTKDSFFVGVSTLHLTPTPEIIF